jgi:hypothetical protein
MACQTPDRPDRGVRYRSLSSFYLADPRRIASQERDLGLWWKVGMHGPSYRAAWVRETGELYAARLGMPREQGEIHVLGQGSDKELEKALEGWTDVCPQPDSMTWLRHRAMSLAEPEAPSAITAEPQDPASAGRRAHVAKATPIGTGRCAKTTRADVVGVSGRRAHDWSAVTARRPLGAISDAGASSSGPAEGSRRRVDTKLLALVATTAAITAPATVLLMELSVA